MRTAFREELEELRLQVEVMALLAGRALDQAVEVLLTGDEILASAVMAADDEIDAMLVSLTTRCEDLIARQQPVASDLRLLVSVLRLLTEFERIGDLALRIVRLAPDQPLIASNPRTFGILESMAEESRKLYQCAVDAWGRLDGDLASSLSRRDDAMDRHYAELTTAIIDIEGPQAVPLAIATITAGRALERIADHAVIIGTRLCYLLTGDVARLTDEAR